MRGSRTTAGAALRQPLRKLTAAPPLSAVTCPIYPHEPDDPLVGSIAQQLLADREAHDKTAAEWTKRYASG
jgi:ubiquitin-conjugating enzyme E2 D/E